MIARIAADLTGLTGLGRCGMTADGLDLSRAAWRKSTYSNNGGSCVEVGTGATGVVAVRDSTNSDGPKLVFTLQQWTTFTSTVKR